MRLRRAQPMRSGWLPLIVLTANICACTPATPLGIAIPGHVNKTQKTYRGVVNGFWQYDVTRNKARLTGSWGKAEEATASALASRYLVRMGIDRSYVAGKFAGLVVLPEGWVYSLADVIDDGRTINIGDVVDTRTIIGTNLVEVVAIVRKCNAAAVPDENKDWSIGCTQVEGFDSFGYAGKRYFLSIF